MNKIYKAFMCVVAATAMLFTACSPDDYKLGAIDVTPEELVEGIAYTITHDVDNPNIVYLESKMNSKYTPLWNHPQGRSQEQKVTLKIPFEGIYEVQFGLETDGGVIYGEPTTFEVDDFCADFVSDPLWELLSGGVGQEKTWYLDLDAEKVSRRFLGPIYFFTETYTWDNLHTASGDNYIDADAWDWESAITPLAGEDGSAEWYWMADYASNSWMCDAADFGAMTFDLKGGANVTVDQSEYGLGNQKGVYMLDVDKHTIKFTDAYPVHDSSRDEAVKSATEFRILYLTEDAMQILVYPEGACYNYISKEYKDSWTPGEEEEAEPTLPDGWETDISQTVTTTIKWVLSPETPFNWAGLDGSLMNEWNSLEDYPDWTGFDASVPATYADFSLVMDSKANTVIYTAPDGTVEEGTYTLDDKGVYAFNGVTPGFNICSWVNMDTTADNEWRITKIDKDLSGNVVGMWVGARDPEKPEYMVYYLIPEAAGGSSEVDYGTAISIDNTKIVFGDLEDNGNFRIEIYNEWGATATVPVIDPSDIVFDNSLAVQFTISGIALNSGAAGSYKAAISFASGDWSTDYWGGGDGDVTISKDGTYTVWFSGASSSGVTVFTVDIANLATDLADIDAVTVTLDKVFVK